MVSVFKALSSASNGIQDSASWYRTVGSYQKTLKTRHSCVWQNWRQVGWQLNASTSWLLTSTKTQCSLSSLMAKEYVFFENSLFVSTFNTSVGLLPLHPGGMIFLKICELLYMESTMSLIKNADVRRLVHSYRKMDRSPSKFCNLILKFKGCWRGNELLTTSDLIAASVSTMMMKMRELKSPEEVRLHPQIGFGSPSFGTVPIHSYWKGNKDDFGNIAGHYQQSRHRQQTLPVRQSFDYLSTDRCFYSALTCRWHLTNFSYCKHIVNSVNIRNLPIHFIPRNLSVNFQKQRFSSIFSSIFEVSSISSIFQYLPVSLATMY